MERSGGDAHNVHMSEKPHYIREWRLAKGLTLEQLAERVDMTHQNLGKIERYKVPYNEHLLGKLEDALGVSKGTLISDPPPEPEEGEQAPPNNLAAWRRFRGLTQAELARKASISETDVAEVEKGNLPLTGRRLTALAAALETTIGRLKEIDPTDIDPEILDDFLAIAKDRRDEARRILKVLGAREAG